MLDSHSLALNLLLGVDTFDTVDYFASFWLFLITVLGLSGDLRAKVAEGRPFFGESITTLKLLSFWDEWVWSIFESILLFTSWYFLVWAPNVNYFLDAEESSLFLVDLGWALMNVNFLEGVETFGVKTFYDFSMTDILPDFLDNCFAICK